MARWCPILTAVPVLLGLLNVGGLPAVAVAGEDAHMHGAATMQAKTQTPPVELNPAAGQALGAHFEAFLSPMQEPNEESNTPKGVPKQFLSTAPSKTRAEREAAGHRGHGVVRFTQDLSRAYVDVKIEGIRAQDINMFHIHCGKPGVLGPILVDFSAITSIQENLADGVFSVEITNEAITKTLEHGTGLVGAFTAGCIIPSATLEPGKPPKVSTVAGMWTIAQEGELYFNLHTVGQTYYGDIRGQLVAAPTASK